MPSRSSTRPLQSHQGLRPCLHLAGAWVLVLAAVMLPAGCASQRPVRPPLGDLLSHSKYRPLTPSFLDETSARDETWHAGEAREGERAPVGPSTGFAPMRQGSLRLMAHPSGHVDVPAPKPVFRPGPPPPGLDAPGEPSSPPRIAPSPQPRPPIQSPTPGPTAIQSPPIRAPQPIALPMPFWARVAALVLLPGTAHAPGQVPECEKARSHRNEHLAGQRHPVTGVLYNNGGYPIFEPIVEVTMPEELRGPEVSDARQFADASRQLRERLERRPMLESSFSPEQIEAIKKGWPRIPGLTWHHHEDGVTLQLVDRDTHARTGHSGGREASGGRPK
ncbi:MAG TPA: HNH endonuclease [Archangium sp.]|nr:HNH endonuclease [Archangium sp.]